MPKRTLDSFFGPPAKKSKTQPPNSNPNVNITVPFSTESKVASTDDIALPPPLSLSSPFTHNTYPYSVPLPPSSLAAALSNLSQVRGKEIRNQPDLDLVYYHPFFPRDTAKELFNYLRQELFFYRVKYSIKRFGKDTVVNTPRFTTVFGVDETARFSSDGSIVSTLSPSIAVLNNRYTQPPRPIPPLLDYLRQITELATNATYNFCLVNYYADGNDSISYHSDDESFLGDNPTIASFSLGGERDFIMRHKPPPEPKDGDAIGKEVSSSLKDLGSLKLSVGSGNMVLMRGPTQSHWLHSIPKRKGKNGPGGRINITFRKAMVPAGTNNYYRYNVGDGCVWQWDVGAKEMKEWKG